MQCAISSTCKSLGGVFLVPLAGLPSHAETHLVEFAHFCVHLACIWTETLHEPTKFLDDVVVLKGLLDFVLGATHAHLLRKVQYAHQFEQVVVEVAALVLLPKELGGHEVSEWAFEAIQQLVATVNQDTVVVLETDVVSALEHSAQLDILVVQLALIFVHE